MFAAAQDQLLSQFCVIPGGAEYKKCECIDELLCINECSNRKSVTWLQITDEPYLMLTVLKST
jgi:hypothetical protein